MFEILAPPDLQVPVHVHHREHETFVILEGSASFVVAGKTIHAGAGDLLFGPRGVPHSYTVGRDGVRMLFCFSPGENMEVFVAETAVPAHRLTLPPAELTPVSPEQLEASLKAHGLEFI